MESHPDPAHSAAASDAFAHFLIMEQEGSPLSHEELLAGIVPEAREELSQLLADLENLRANESALFAPVDATLQLGPYQLLEELGQGGAGTVWRALDTRLDREVALKVLHSHLTFSERQVQRFEDEAATHASLHHPGIIQIFDIGYEQGTHYIAQELVPKGRTLADFIAECSKGLLEAGHDREVCLIFAEIAQSVGAAHEAGIVHRDLKPSNVLLTPDYHVRVTDFGLARLAGTTTLSLTSARSGTPFYFSPEQAAGDRMVDARSDVFSLGITLYELLTLQRPFSGETTDEVARAILRSDPIPPQKLRPRIPRELVWIIAKALERNPARRYADASELGDDIECWLQGRRITARAMRPHEHVAKYAQRHPALSIGAAVGGTALAVISSLLFINRDLRIEAERDNTHLRAALEATRDAVTYMSPGNVLERGNTPPEFLAELVRNARETFTDDRESLAELLAMAGKFYRELGFTRESVEVLEEASALLEVQSDPLDKRLFELRLLLLGDLVMRFELDRARELGEMMLGALEASTTPRNPIHLARLQSTLMRANRWTNDSEARERIEARLGATAKNIETALLSPEAEPPLVRANLQLDLAYLIGNAGEPQRAVDLAEIARATITEHLGINSLAALEATYWLNSLRSYVGDFQTSFDEAIVLVQRTEQNLGPNHPLSLHAKWLKAQGDMKQSRMDEAFEGYAFVVQELAKWLPWESPRMLAVRTAFAMSANYSGRYKAAEEQLIELIETKQRVLGEGSISTLITRRAFSEVLIRTHQFERARDEVLEQAELHEKYRDSQGHLETMYAMEGICEASLALADWEGLKQLLDRYDRKLALPELENRANWELDRFHTLCYLNYGPTFHPEALTTGKEMLAALPPASLEASLHEIRERLRITLQVAELLGLSAQWEEQASLLETVKSSSPIYAPEYSSSPNNLARLNWLRAEAHSGMGQAQVAKQLLDSLDWEFLETGLWPLNAMNLARIANQADYTLPVWMDWTQDR